MEASALIAQGKIKAGLPLLLEVIADERHLMGQSSDTLVDDYNLLCEAYENDDQPDAAIAACRAAIDMAKALRHESAWNVSVAYNRLGVILQRAGKFADSESALRDALHIREQLHGADHSGTVVVRSNLLRLLEIQGRYAETLAARIAMVEAARRNEDARPGELAFAHMFLGDAYDTLGRSKEAETELRRSLEVWARVQGANKGLEYATALKYLGGNLQHQGRYDEAAQIYREVIAMGEAQAASATLAAEAVICRAELGNVLRLQHRYTEALHELAAAAGAPPGSGKNAGARLAVIQARYAEAQLDAGDAPAAQATATQAVALSRKNFNGHTPRIAIALYALARADLALERGAEAEALLREALAARSPPMPANDLRAMEVEVALVTALSLQQKTTEADALRARIEPALQASASPYASDLLARLPRK